METNRDDFIIAIRSAFLKKGTKQRFSLIVLLFFSIIILTLSKYNFKGIAFLKSGLNEIVYRASFIISAPENFIVNTYKLTMSHINLYDDHKKLKEDFKALKAENLSNNFIISENIMLKSKIEDIVDISSEILAKVLVDKQSPFLKSIIVNRGSKDKVKLGMAVLDGDFLIGKVVEVNYLTSRVLLLSDLNSKVPVSVEPNSVQSILTGTGEKFGKLQYTQLESFDLNNGDQVYTSGSGGIFKSGIPVGEINIIDESKESYVLFHSNFSQLRLVKIVLFENINYYKSILDENGWRNILEIKRPNSESVNSSYDYSTFIADTVPFDFGGFVADLEQGPDGLVYAAIRGSYIYQASPAPRYSGGVLIIDVDNPSNITAIDTVYLSYHATTTNSDPYLVVLDIEFDKSGNMWIADPYSINGNNPLHVRSKNGKWR